jgi:FkbM family methyltransferase
MGSTFLRNLYINDQTRAWTHSICDSKRMRGILWELLKFSGVDRLDVTRAGVNWRLTVRDAVISRSIFVEGDYDREPFDHAIEYLQQRKLIQGDTFVDIGANVGTHTLYALSRKTLFQAAICFEPNPYNADILRYNTTANGYSGICEVAQVALGESEGTVTMELSPTNFGDHRVRRAEAVAEQGNLYVEHTRATIAVPQVNLSEWLTNRGIPVSRLGFISIDVQGYEAFVLLGGQSLCAAGIPLYLEFWPYGLNRTNSLQTLIQLLSTHYTKFLDMRGDRAERKEHAISDLPALATSLNPDDGINLLFYRA